MIAEASYDTELIAFKPKMRSMIRNFQKTGYRFHGYDNDDLTQELFLKALEIKPLYDPKKAAMKTWWYRCFRSRLVAIEDESETVLRWLVGIHNNFLNLNFSGAYLSACIAQNGVDWHDRALLAAQQMMDKVKKFDPECAMLCQLAIKYNGSRKAIGKAMGKGRRTIKNMLVVLRCYVEYEIALDAIPF